MGLTSDDEDYISPNQDEEKLSSRLSVESFSEVEPISVLESVLDHIVGGKDKMDDSNMSSSVTSSSPPNEGRQPRTENSDSESDRPIR